MALAHYTLDIRTLPLPTSGPSNPFRFYVVVDPDNTIAGETHEWHQTTVVLTPDTSINPQTPVCVEVQDAQGTSIETVCYTVQTRDDQIPANLAEAINKSHTAM